MRRSSVSRQSGSEVDGGELGLNSRLFCFLQTPAAVVVVVDT